jgi:hypothetical protein
MAKWRGRWSLRLSDRAYSPSGYVTVEAKNERKAREAIIRRAKLLMMNSVSYGDQPHGWEYIEADCIEKIAEDEKGKKTEKKAASFISKASKAVFVVFIAYAIFGHTPESANRIESAKQAIAFSGSVYFPLERRDIPEPCSNQPTIDICKGAFEEFNHGFGSIRCGYYNKENNKTWNYFFWYKKVPQNVVALGKNDSKASIRALGTIPVQECPKTQDEAEALYRQNDK